MNTNERELHSNGPTRRLGSGEIQFQGCDLSPALAICICSHKPTHAPNKDRILARLVEAGTDLSSDFSLLLDGSGKEDVLLFFGNRKTFQTFKLLSDTLWSLNLDSQEAGEHSPEWALRELADGYIGTAERNSFNRQAYRVLAAIASDAATRMREACAEKIRERLAVLEKQTSESGGLARACCEGRDSAIRDIITALQSLTLDQVEQKQS